MGDTDDVKARYPRRPRGQHVPWAFLFKLPGGHSYFRDDGGFVAVADDSGHDPDCTESGALYVIVEEPIRFGRFAMIKVVDTEGVRAAIMESPQNGIDLADRLGMRINARGHAYSLCDKAAAP